MPSRPTDPTSNHAPQVLDEQIIGNIADKQLELTGTYYDEEGDEPDVEQFTFRWLKDGVEIPDADDYILPVSDASALLGVTVSGCVTPSKTGELVGDEYCTDLSIGLSSDISAEVTIDSSVFPLPGNTISASYTYDDNGAGIPKVKVYLVLLLILWAMIICQSLLNVNPVLVRIVCMILTAVILIKPFELVFSQLGRVLKLVHLTAIQQKELALKLLAHWNMVPH
ncbi:hypothetical protein AAFX60_020385 [Aliivibrio fischeri]